MPNSVYYLANKERLNKQSRQLYHVNKQHHNEWRRQYRLANKERLRQYRLVNKEKINKQHRQWSAANKEKTSERGRQYRLVNKEKIKEHKCQYHLANKDKSSLNRSKRRAHLAAATINDFTTDQWRLVKAHYGHCCVYCQKKSHRLSMDHITPISKRGNHTMSNIVPACVSCNCSKQAGPVPVPVQPLLL